jgi:hypothetical protein
MQHTNKQPHTNHPTTRTPPPPEEEDQDPAQGIRVRGYKMLASTIQISNNNPTPEPPHPTV